MLVTILRVFLISVLLVAITVLIILPIRTKPRDYVRLLIIRPLGIFIFFVNPGLGKSRGQIRLYRLRKKVNT